jgi:hypothetical protein
MDKQNIINDISNLMREKINSINISNYNSKLNESSFKNEITHESEINIISINSIKKSKLLSEYFNHKEEKEEDIIEAEHLENNIKNINSNNCKRYSDYFKQNDRNLINVNLILENINKEEFQPCPGILIF